MNHRKYSEFDEPEKIIMVEVMSHGKSEGWSGTIEERITVQNILGAFNVHYTDDISGTWSLRKYILMKD
jgi:hypothetical protein